jgi:hypothetical protein
MDIFKPLSPPIGHVFDPGFDYELRPEWSSEPNGKERRETFVFSAIPALSAVKRNINLSF